MTSELSPVQPTSGNSFASRTTLVDNRETSPTRSGTGRLRGMEEGKSPVRPARRGKVAKVSMLQRVFNLCAAILSFFRSLPATVHTFFCATVPAFFRSLRKPAEEVGPIPGFKESVRAIVFNSCMFHFAATPIEADLNTSQGSTFCSASSPSVYVPFPPHATVFSSFL